MYSTLFKLLLSPTYIVSIQIPSPYPIIIMSFLIFRNLRIYPCNFTYIIFTTSLSSTYFIEIYIFHRKQCLFQLFINPLILSNAPFYIVKTPIIISNYHM
jgi:hypothetical protein